MEVPKKELAFPPFKLLILPSTRSAQQESREESLFQSSKARVLSVLSFCTDVFSETFAHVPVLPAPYLSWAFLLYPLTGPLDFQSRPSNQHHSQTECAPPLAVQVAPKLLTWLTDLRTRQLHKCYFRSSACTCTRRCPYVQLLFNKNAANLF